MKEKQYKYDKKKRRNALPFCSALNIFAINVDNVAMKLNLFYDVVFSKQTHFSKQAHIYLFSSYKQSCLSGRIRVVKGATSKAQGTCYVLPSLKVHNNLNCWSQQAGGEGALKPLLHW